ncbi:MAG: hypothetical protein HY914_20495 [Desulfomonile tiedjei]|nr:hypothetical protein [Desulfomonile tiedjei]
MRHTRPRFRIRARLSAVQRRRKAVEFMVSLASSEPNGFFLFRKRNPFANRVRDRERALLEETEEQKP